jgi:hypothetical protein
MTGKINNDWELLKYQLVQRWGKMMPLMKYPRESLDNLIWKAKKEGEIMTPKAFQDFSTKLDTILGVDTWLVWRKLGTQYSTVSLQNFVYQLTRSWSEMTRWTWPLIDHIFFRHTKLSSSTYIRNSKTLSILQMEEEAFSKEVQDKSFIQKTAVNKTPSPEKAIEEITKTLSSWNIQKKPSTFYQSSNVPYAPFQNTRPPESFFYHYCHLKGHSTGRFNLCKILTFLSTCFHFLMSSVTFLSLSLVLFFCCFMFLGLFFFLLTWLFFLLQLLNLIQSSLAP